MKVPVALGILVLGAILRSDAYTASYQSSPSYSPTGYSYGSYSPGYSVCSSLKVTEVLDQIYCHHGYYTRFTSTDLAAIKVVLYQLGLVTKFAHIQAVLDYVEQAIYILQELKEETYKSYDTSLLTKYYNIADYDYQDLQDALQNRTASLAGFEAIRRGYRAQFGMITWGTFTANPYATDYSTSATQYSTGSSSYPSSSTSYPSGSTSYPSGSTSYPSGSSSYPSGSTSYPSSSKVNYKRTAQLGGQSSVRRVRAPDSEYDYAGDYTCGYISSSYCSANSIIVKNVLYRVLVALKSLDDALTILYDYIQNHDCGTDNDGKYALLVTADTFGSTLCAASVLLEAAQYEYNLYKGMAGASTYNSNMYGRASGGSGGSSPYQGFPYQYQYVAQTPYRYQRGAVLVRTPAAVPMIVG